MNVDKLRNCFDEMVVYKDLKRAIFNSLSLPSFMRDWILKKFEDEDGSFDTEKVAAFVKSICLRRMIGIQLRIVS